MKQFVCAQLPRNILKTVKCEVHVPTPPPPSPSPTEGEYRQLDQTCQAVNNSSLKRTSNSFMKLTTLATMSATVEAKTSSTISRATLRLLASGQSILDFYGFQNQVSSTLHCDLQP